MVALAVAVPGTAAAAAPLPTDSERRPVAKAAVYKRHRHHVMRAQRNKKIARKLVRRHWAGGRQYRCLDRLWTSESGWNHRARNPRSGAYGIPQALPAGKMARSGNDWRTNPRTQIRWGLRYVKSRYRTPCRAWAFWREHRWY
ncbi:transglycosylase SLT domain-containing protein [Thermomonospora umbrina]|uniref:aggregation-promoting factor C-terminal-like domain-containing protein n=1 Tax=Thermomonospora umbrina TaxID=111806 RepID=UPI001FEA93CC|nr:transglycosylase SLT domain-containing protein [Thermomonospora umbrina]